MKPTLAIPATVSLDDQRAYVHQLEAALKQYMDDARYPASASRYGDLDGLIRTARYFLYVENNKLRIMEAVEHAAACNPSR